MGHGLGVSGGRTVYWRWLGLALATLAALAIAGTARAEFGRLIVAQGEAQVERRGLVIPVRATFTLLDGDRVRTLAGAKAYIELTGSLSGGRAVLTQSTTLDVHELAAGQTRSPLTLAFGAVRASLQRFLGGVPFVSTATATVGIKGTDFIVYVKREVATEFIGVEGLIECVSRSRPDYSIRIGHRQWGEIVEGEKPKPPIHVPDDQWEGALREFSYPGQ
ncbi:MAG: hypothetical protein HY423_08645 [Candidatus Lambdaproteobacteria bacterium]|nr:hypothetical protein [Candidatus Lambdaproteobacteria bacterium]